MVPKKFKNLISLLNSVDQSSRILGITMFHQNCSELTTLQFFNTLGYVIDALVEDTELCPHNDSYIKSTTQVWFKKDSGHANAYYFTEIYKKLYKDDKRT